MSDVLFPEISWLSWIGPYVGQTRQSLLIPTCQLFEIQPICVGFEPRRITHSSPFI